MIEFNHVSKIYSIRPTNPPATDFSWFPSIFSRTSSVALEVKQTTMLQRSARLRREYLYRKDLEGKELATLERRKQLKEALDGSNAFLSFL